ncbi:MAG TPA: CHRD domain-containing protein [Myxococcota bacterium]|nr:CHRD domain-containing protein [Myxococcota bacterium]
MKRIMLGLAFLLGIVVTTPPAHAMLITFTATLDGSQQVPLNASTATGFGTVVLDDVADTMKVDLSWQGLSGPAIAAHIHGPGAAGTNAAILFPFANVPAVISGSMPEQMIPITPAQIADLEAGLYYMNIHTAMFPLGEIRGQLTQVPEPGTLALIAGGAFGLAVGAKQRRTRA